MLMRVAEVVTSQLALNQCRALYVIGCLRTYEKSTCVWNEALLRKYEAATLLPLSTHELLCNFARVKRSAHFSLRVPKARFMGGSPASFFMRFGALHWKKQVLRLAFFLAPRTGLEPVTSWLTVTRSTDWAIEEYMILSTQGGGI